MMTNQNLYSDLAIAPGEYLTEVLEDLGMSQAELARRMGRPIQTINEIVKGNKAVTPDTALQLEKVTGVPAYLWVGLEDEYRLTLARQEEQEQLEREAELLRPGCFDPKLYNEMAKFGWVEKTRKKVEKVKELLRFFGVSSLFNLADVRSYAPAFRVAKSQTNCNNYALAAWLRRGELEAKHAEQEIDTKPFDVGHLKAAIPKLRALTLKSPEVFLPEARTLLADCGTILLVIPHLPKTYAHGATFWLSPAKVVVQLSIRQGWADIFWFSLFHELAHILLHGKRDTILSFRKREDYIRVYGDVSSIEKEDEADAFARNTLIPSGAYREFVAQEIFTKTAVRAFAERIEVAPGIVVGRLQHDIYLDYSEFHDLRERYVWSD